jgi:hypothetical protein
MFRRVIFMVFLHQPIQIELSGSFYTKARLIQPSANSKFEFRNRETEDGVVEGLRPYPVAGLNGGEDDCLNCILETEF